MLRGSRHPATLGPPLHRYMRRPVVRGHREHDCISRPVRAIGQDHPGPASFCPLADRDLHIGPIVTFRPCGFAAAVSRSANDFTHTQVGRPGYLIPAAGLTARCQTGSPVVSSLETRTWRS